MTSRERVFAALAHEQPDRCPVDLLLEGTTARTLRNHFHVDSDQELIEILEADLQFVFPDSTLPPRKESIKRVFSGIRCFDFFAAALS